MLPTTPTSCRSGAPISCQTCSVKVRASLSRAVVTKGRIGEDGMLYADAVLAKHDESYMPPEVADTLQTAHVEGVADQQLKSGGVAQ